MATFDEACTVARLHGCTHYTTGGTKCCVWFGQRDDRGWLQTQYVWWRNIEATPEAARGLFRPDDQVITNAYKMVEISTCENHST